MDDYEKLRQRNRMLDRRRAETNLAYGPLGRPMQGSPCLLGKVIDGGSKPTSTGHYFLVNPGRYGGEPVEGGTGTGTWDTTRKVPVYIVGGSVPAVGDEVVARLVSSGRWVAEGKRGPTPCTADDTHVCLCGCNTPLTKTPTIADDNGTHTMTWDGAFFVTPTITQSFTLYNSGCSGAAGDLRYRYQLSCVGSGDTQVWRLFLRVPVRFCSPSYRYSDGDWTTGTTQNHVDIPSGCDESLTLDFTLPSSVIANDNTITGLAQPGGGGTVTCVF